MPGPCATPASSTSVWGTPDVSGTPAGGGAGQAVGVASAARYVTRWRCAEHVGGQGLHVEEATLREQHEA